MFKMLASLPETIHITKYTFIVQKASGVKWITRTLQLKASVIVANLMYREINQKCVRTDILNLSRCQNRPMKFFQLEFYANPPNSRKWNSINIQLKIRKDLSRLENLSNMTTCNQSQNLQMLEIMIWKQNLLASHVLFEHVDLVDKGVFKETCHVELLQKMS